MLTDLLSNRIFIAALLGWFVAQLIKVPIEYVRHRRLNWGLWFSAGGMPSSHSSLINPSCYLEKEKGGCPCEVW